MKQEYKVVKDGFEVFFFAHGLKSAYDWAIESFNKAISTGKYNNILLYSLNQSNFGPKWSLINKHCK